MALACVGRHEEAIAQYELSFRLNPNSQYYVIKNVGAAYCALGRYEEMINFTNKWIHLRTNDLWIKWSHINLAVAFNLLGLEEDAKAETEKLLELSPYYSIDLIKKALFFMKNDDLKQYISALRNTGIPEHENT